MAATAKAKSLAQVAPRKKLGDEIADTLRQAILSGEYATGEKIGLEDLANQLGVSIMPVREALITLSNEGLVDVESRRGFRARPLSQSDLDDLFEIQAHLTGILVGRAAKVITPEDLEELRANHKALVALSKKPMTPANLRKASQLNAEFHRYIAKIPDGDRVRWFLRLTHRYVRSDLYEAVPGVLDASLNDHPAIIDALERGDAEGAARLAEKHFVQGADLIGCTTESS
jgi:DNA-binding GntR family transcriptional regulator